jgi:1-deoxy-D-xylulose-5-phosphate reductoisomerase
MKQIAILGATGSIGVQSLDVIAQFPDRFCVHGLTAHTRMDDFQQQIERFRPQSVAVSDETSATLLPPYNGSPEVRTGPEALTDIVTHPDVDLVISALPGSAGFLPTLRAIEAGKTVALANKEILVMAGQLVIGAAKQSGAVILPLDSEHSAIHQCLAGQDMAQVRRIVLTASGGPFLSGDHDLTTVSPGDALAHPTWDMGRKVTIDSATMMNKGFEVIEAHWLFGLPFSQIDVVIHPQSIVHSMVELVDGAILAQLGIPDMRLPIQYALTYPERLPAKWPRFDLTRPWDLHFEPPNYERFPCLRLAYEAGAAGGTLPAVLSAADEVAVESFLEMEIAFSEIPTLISGAMDSHTPGEFIGTDGSLSLDSIIGVDSWTRQYCRQIAG